MSNLIETAFVFFIVIAAGFIGLSVLANQYSISTGNCAYNASGSLVNCTLSNAQYQMMNNSGQQYGLIFSSIGTPLTWVLGTGVILALFVSIVAFLKK